MALNTSRVAGVAAVAVDYPKCTACGLCVTVCKGGPLYTAGGRVEVDQSRYFGCIACGHCLAICPHGCIAVEGRDLSPADVVQLPDRQDRASYGQLRNLLSAGRHRRRLRLPGRPLQARLTPALRTRRLLLATAG